MLNWADYSIIAVVGLSVGISFIRGFVREALSLIIWVAAFWIAFTFYDTLALLLTHLIHTDTLRTVISFLTLLISTLILGALINYLIGQLVDKTGLSGTDRLLGVLFGCARGVLLVTVFLLLTRLTPMPQEAAWWKDSVLIPYFHPIEIWLHGLLPESVTQHLILTY